jgi:hypothetical protein
MAVIETVAATAAIVSSVSSIVGGLSGSKSAKRAKRAEKRSIRAQMKEDIRASVVERNYMLGSQQTGYAAGGVVVGIGTPASIENELKEFISRKQRAIALQAHWAQKGASARGNAAVASGYMQAISGAVGAAQGVSNLGSARGWWG